MSEIQPIPTEYAGVRFRSRLEARWAVYFDAIGVKWQYEREGYQLPSGWHIPDFYLSVEHVWVSVKFKAGYSKDDVLKCRDLCESTGEMVIMTDGPPSLAGHEYFQCVSTCVHANTKARLVAVLETSGRVAIAPRTEMLRSAIWEIPESEYGKWASGSNPIQGAMVAACELAEKYRFDWSGCNA